jgi:hypothetical protein
MLEGLFGSKNRERVLQFILANDEGYAKEIADFYTSSLDPIQKQLERLELHSILVSKNVGRTRVFMFNPRYQFLEELKNLLKKVREYYEPEELERLTMGRKRPRRKGKPSDSIVAQKISDDVSEGKEKVYGADEVFKELGLE